jgi:TolB-like protein
MLTPHKILEDLDQLQSAMTRAVVSIRRGLLLGLFFDHPAVAAHPLKLTDDLTTDLSHLPDSFVIAHSTALTYKGKAVEAKQLRKLGVRYALEGSVRRVGETIAVNAQLISTESGAHVWADRLEGERNRLGALQAELVSRIAAALGVQPPKAAQPAP